MKSRIAGRNTREYLDKMLTEPFEPFVFSPAGAAIFQLGPYARPRGNSKSGPSILEGTYFSRSRKYAGFRICRIRHSVRASNANF